MKIKLFVAALVCFIFIAVGFLMANHKTSIASGSDVDDNRHDNFVRQRQRENLRIYTLQCVGSYSMNDRGFLQRFDDYLEIFGCRLIKLRGVEYHITDPNIISEMHALGALEQYHSWANIARVVAIFRGIRNEGAESLFRQWDADREADANWYFIRSRGSFTGSENRGELKRYLKKWKRCAKVSIINYKNRQD